MWTHFIRQGRGTDRAKAPAPVQSHAGEATSLRQRITLCRIEELEREIAGEFGTEELAPLLAELAAHRAELH